MINHVNLTFEYRENMPGVTIIQSVISYDEYDKIIENYQNLVNAQFFGDDGEDEAKSFVAEKLGISENIIDIDSDFIETPWDN